MSIAWIPTHNRTLFPYWKHHGTPRRKCLVKNGLRIPFTDTGIRLTKLPSTTGMFTVTLPATSRKLEYERCL